MSRYRVGRPELVCGPSKAIVSRGYIFIGEHVTVGVERRRALDGEGQPIGDGIDRLLVNGASSVELPLSAAAAAELFRTTEAKTVCTEYGPLVPSMPWVLWVYHFHNEGLVIAESLLGLGNRVTELPEWCDDDITDDARFTDERLAIRPYSDFGEIS